MSHEGRLSPVELLRQLTLSFERLAAQGLASGAVRGATEELRAGLPQLDGQLEALLQDLLTILGRLAHEAAERPAWEPGTWPRLAAEGAVRGVLEELRRDMPRWSTFSRELAERLNRWLDRQDRLAEGKERDLHVPGLRMRSAAAGAVEGALEQLHGSMPLLTPMAAELASQMGRGFVEGLGSKVEERAEVFAAFLERVGRSFVQAIVEQLDTELKALRGAMDGDMSRAAAELAEHMAAASVRGAAEELVRQLHRPREAASGEGALRRAGREVSSGILSALSERLRKPLAVAAGTGSALLLAALLVKRGR